MIKLSLNQLYYKFKSKPDNSKNFLWEVRSIIKEFTSRGYTVLITGKERVNRKPSVYTFYE